MSRSLILLGLILTLLGCDRRQHEKIKFESIDYTFWAGYYRSVKIMGNGETYVYYKFNYPEREICYNLKIDKVNLDSISKMVKSLNIEYPDSTYQLITHEYQRGTTSCLLIKLNKESHIMLIKKENKSEKEIKVLRSLINLLNNLSYGVKKSSDSGFVFESMNYLILPPPPPLPPIKRNEKK